MTEAVILPEMLQAGVEAIRESRRRKLTDLDMAVAVFLAMRALEEMYVIQEDVRVIH